MARRDKKDRAPRPFQRRLIQRRPDGADASRRWSLAFALLLALIILFTTYALVVRQNAQPECLYSNALGQPCGVTPTPFVLTVVPPSPSTKPPGR